MPADVDAAAPLFDAYRQFYDRKSDLAGARAFLAERLAHGESVVLLAVNGDDDGAPVGFAQLYPTFSSVSLARVVVLNDLFVEPAARGHGVGRRLLEATIEHARSVGACRVELSTAVTNERARRLYRALGFGVERDFDHMSLELG